MQTGKLEHVNFTVSDPKKTAEMLCRLFGWHIRWEGEAKNAGYTIHVGSDDDYLAIYTNAGDTAGANGKNYHTAGGLNHIGVVVDDLKAAEARVKAEGFTPHSHADYEPGTRFYFDDGDGIEFEVVSYQ
ncbi:MAG: VOC family protein [Rhizobiaceae bacterium]